MILSYTYFITSLIIVWGYMYVVLSCDGHGVLIKIANLWIIYRYMSPGCLFMVLYCPQTKLVCLSVHIGVQFITLLCLDGLSPYVQ